MSAMSAVRSAPFCHTLGCTGSGDHVCTVLRAAPRPRTAEDEQLRRELVRDVLRARWRLTI